MTTIDRTSMTIRQTSPRMTPPPSSRQFREVLTRSGEALLAGAVAAAEFLPGGNVLAAAVRGAGTSFAGSAGRATAAYGTAEGPQPGVGGTQVPTPEGVDGGTATAGTSAEGGTGAGTGTSSGAGMDSQGNDMLARSQEMSMKMLQLQEAMGEENRRYTALSNVLHARNEMAKNAIGNIR